MKKLVFGMILALALTACASTKMTGTTVANAQLQEDTMKALLPYAQAKLNCNTIQSVHTSPVSVSSAGVVTERWELSSCNNKFAVRVDFTPDASGGVGINITAAE